MKVTENQELFVVGVIIGGTPQECKIVLSNGCTLGGLMSLEVHPINVKGEISIGVELRVHKKNNDG